MAEGAGKEGLMEQVTTLQARVEELEARETHLERPEFGDEDESGTLGKQEFIKGCLKLEVPMNLRELEIVFEELDWDGSGTMEYRELFAATKRS